MADALHTLYGSPLSLYTGKARSYLIKNRIAYRELTPTSAHFGDYVRPAAGGRTVPVVESADGRVIRDSTAIIDYFESLSGGSAMPSAPVKRLLARLLDVVGSEGLLRPAMHYRWNFAEENLAFLQFHFQAMIPASLGGKAVDRATLAANTMNRMRNAGVAFGAVPDRFVLIESLYAEFLALLDAHLEKVPYVLGNRPSIADYGLIAPLYAHLGRDPKPLAIMQRDAVHVFRWVERMNRPEPDMGEYPCEDAGFMAATSLDNDMIPDTLVALLKHIARDLVPETLAAAATINAWLAEQDPAPGMAVERSVGMCEFEVAGETFNAIAQPYRFFLLARMQRELAALGGEAAESAAKLLAVTNLAPLAGATLQRDIVFTDNRETWQQAGCVDQIK